MDGIINLKKSSGVTSFDCVAAVRKILGVGKVGHAGTLDPEAGGVLPVLIGKATKLSDVFLQMPKRYKGKILFGKATDTQDIWGDVTEEVSSVSLTQEDFENVVMSFKGPSLQVPPIFSALKVGGKPMYKYAREGKTVEAEARPIEIYDIIPGKLIKKENNLEAEVDVTCSRGTYIRTLIYDIGRKCGIPSCMSALTRCAYGPLKIEDAITIEELEHLGKTALMPCETILKDMKHVNLSDKEYKEFVSTGKWEEERKNGIVLKYGDELTAVLIEGRSNIFMGLTEKKKATGVALGNFDGIHKGHQKLFETLRSECLRKDLDPFVYTFYKTCKKDFAIMTNRERITMLNGNGQYGVVAEDFTEEFKSLSPEEFAKKILVDKLNAKLVVIGYDYTFGKDRAGNAETMTEIGKKLGFETVVVPEVLIDGEKVSSTRLRNALSEGRTDEYFKLTGRYYTVKGKVQHGRAVGGTVVGYPTANILPGDSCRLKFGVYSTRVRIKGDSRTYKGITNVGNNPSFEEGIPVSVETFILGLKKDIYNRSISVSFKTFIRGERVFSSPEELTKQITEDLEKVKNED